MPHTPGSPEPAAAAPVGIVDRSQWRCAVTARIPSLRALAWSLCRNPAEADDLVQETLTRAWTDRDRFPPGADLRAWLFTILRSSWYSALARQAREGSDEDGRHAARRPPEGAEDRAVELDDLRTAMDDLPPACREAIVLVGAAGLSYEEAAGIAGCAPGVIRSRVSRARNRLAEVMDVARDRAD